MEPIGEYLHAHLDELAADLGEWVSIPSIAGDAEHRSALRRSAHWLAGEMRAAGLEASVLESGDSWAVLGEFAGDPGAPTALVYRHHDVRTVKPEEWAETEPFTPAQRDGRLYGRGASDAKGQALAHVWALRALRHVHAASPMTVKLLIEGEEEIGSPNLAFFASVMPADAEYELSIGEALGQEPYETPRGPLLDALERALERGYDLPLAGRMGNAGGGPVDLLTRTFDAPVLFLGTGLPEDHWHSSDESVGLRMLQRGAASIAHLWLELAEVLPARQ